MIKCFRILSGEYVKIGMLLCAALLAVTGCTFSRAVTNERFRALDTAWIEPGRTTRAEIVERLGYPPTVREAGGVLPDSFRWIVSDTRTTRFELGYIVTPTFERTQGYAAEDILIKFNEIGVVTLVSRTRSDREKVEVIEWKEVK